MYVFVYVYMFDRNFIINKLTFIHGLLDSPSVGSVSGSGSVTYVGGEGANLSVIGYL